VLLWCSGCSQSCDENLEARGRADSITLKAGKVVHWATDSTGKLRAEEGIDALKWEKLWVEHEADGPFTLVENSPDDQIYSLFFRK
jgi:hypothetical protein